MRKTDLIFWLVPVVLVIALVTGHIGWIGLIVCAFIAGVFLALYRMLTGD